MSWDQIGLWGCDNIDLWNNNRTIKYARTLSPQGYRKVNDCSVDISPFLPAVPNLPTTPISSWLDFDAAAYVASGAAWSMAPKGSALTILRDDPLSVSFLDASLTNKATAGVVAGVQDATAGTAITLAADPVDGYIYMNDANDSLTVPDAANLDIVGDLVLFADVALTNWVSGGAEQALISKWEASGQFSYSLRVSATGAAVFHWSNNGTTDNSATSSVIIPVAAAGGRISIAATIDVDNGATGRDVKFWTKATTGPYGTWTQLGTTVTTATVTSIFSSTSLVRIGTTGAGGIPAGGKFYGCGVTGGLVISTAPVLYVDCTCIGTVGALTFAAVTTQTVTVNRATAGAILTIVPPRIEHGFVRFTGVANQFIESDATIVMQSDTTWVTRISLDDWMKATVQTIVARWSATAANANWRWTISNGILTLQVMLPGGSSSVSYNSTVAVPGVNGQPLTLAVTLDGDNDNGGSTVRFFTSVDDGQTFVQLGAPIVTVAGMVVTNTATSTKYNIGSYGTVGSTVDPLFGRIYFVSVRNGIGVAGVPGGVTYTRWSGRYATSPASTVTTNPDLVGTYTLQGGGSFVMPGLWGRNGWLISGSLSRVEIADHGKLNFGVGFLDNLSAIVACRVDIAAQASAGHYMSKRNGTSGAGWVIPAVTTGLTTTAVVSDGTTTVTSAANAAVTQFANAALGLRINRVSQVIQGSKDGTQTATSSISAVGPEANTLGLRYGNATPSGGTPAYMTLFGGVVIRRALSDAEMTTVAAAMRDGTEQYTAGQAWRVTTAGVFIGLSLTIGTVLVCTRSGTLGTADWAVLTTDQAQSYGLSNFSNPISDRAWWYDAGHVESAYFLGMQVTRVTGLEDSTLNQTTTIGGCGDVQYDRSQNKGFTVTVEAVLHGLTCCGVAYGLRALRRRLSSCCGRGCRGTRLRMMSCIPNSTATICGTSYTPLPETSTSVNPWRNLVNVRLLEQPHVVNRSGIGCGKCGCSSMTKIMFTFKANGALYTDQDITTIPSITPASGATPTASINNAPCVQMFPVADPNLGARLAPLPAGATSVIAFPTTANTRYTTRFVTVPVGEEWELEWAVAAGALQDLRNLRVLIWPNLAGAESATPGFSVYGGIYTTCNAMSGFGVQYVPRLGTWSKTACDGVRVSIGAGYSEPGVVYPAGNGRFNPFSRLTCGKWTILVEADAVNTGADATVQATVRKIDA